MGTAPTLVGELVDAAPTPTVARAELSMSRDQIELIKRTVCKGATDDELDLFLHTAKRLGLDPIAKQVHAVKRWDSQAGREVMAIQVGIDGFRIIAERSGRYAGQSAPQWCGRDGVWREAWLDDAPPAAARVGVLRTDFAEPIVCVARLASYAQTKKGGGMTSMWERMPDVMLAKCAEALALRKAFPSDLSGVYTPDEMGQADNGRDERKAIAQPQRRSAPVGNGNGGGHQEALPPSSGDAWEGIITDVEERNGETKGKPWTLFTIHGDGERFSTFDTKVRDAAEDLRGQWAVVAWEPAKNGGKKALSIMGAAPPEPGSDG